MLCGVSYRIIKPVSSTIRRLYSLFARKRSGNPRRGETRGEVLPAGGRKHGGERESGANNFLHVPNRKIICAIILAMCVKSVRSLTRDK